MRCILSVKPFSGDLSFAKAIREWNSRVALFTIAVLLIFLPGCASAAASSSSRSTDSTAKTKAASTAPATAATTMRSTYAAKASLFDGLTFSSIFADWSKSTNTGHINGKIKNNNSVTVYGYFKLVFYDSKGKMVKVRDSVPIPGSGIRPGETVTFSVLMNKFEYSRVEAEDSTVLAK